MAPSRDDPFALQVTSDLMVKLTKVLEPVPKCQKPKPKQTPQSLTISHPKSISQLRQNKEQVETLTTNGKIGRHDSHKMSKSPPQTRPESASNTHTQAHQTKPLPSMHSSPTKREIEKKIDTHTKDGPHTTKGNKVKEPIGGKKIEGSKTIETQHGFDKTQGSGWERQENIESPKDDPSMGHNYQKPNMSKLDHIIEHQGGSKDLVELEDMHSKSIMGKHVSQNAKNEARLPTSQGTIKNSPQREEELDGIIKQQNGQLGQPTNIYDRHKLDTNVFWEKKIEKKLEVQKKPKIESKGSTTLEHSTASLELDEEEFGRKNIETNLKGHNNMATKSEQRLDNGGNLIHQVASKVEHELARRGISHALEQCVCPSGPQPEAKTNTTNEAKTNIEQNTSNASGEGEFWRRLGHRDLGDSSPRMPQAQPKELTRSETGKQFLQQIESHISKGKKHDRRTDIRASIIQRATLQATMTEIGELGEDDSEIFEFEYPNRSPSPKISVQQSPPRIADQRFTWPRTESLVTPKAHDERAKLHQGENHDPQSRKIDRKEIHIPKLKKDDIKEVHVQETKKLNNKDIHNIDSKQVDQGPQDGQSRVSQQRCFCLHEKDACVDCYKKNAQNPLECADAVRLYKECSQRIRKVGKGAYGGTTTCPSKSKNHVTK